MMPSPLYFYHHYRETLTHRLMPLLLQVIEKQSISQPQVSKACTNRLISGSIGQMPARRRKVILHSVAARKLADYHDDDDYFYATAAP